MSIIVIPNKKIIKHLQLSLSISSVIEDIVKQEIVMNKVQELEIQVSKQELQQGCDRLRIAQKLYKTEDTMSWLEENYISPEDFEELIRFQITTEKLIEHLFSEQVEPFFYQHQQDFIGAVIYEVFLDDHDLALDLYYSITENELTFNQVAHQYISDPQLRRLGGYKGIVSREHLKPEVSSAIFAAQPPQVLRPIITPTGVLLIYVEEIIQPVLNDSLKSQILNRLFSNWLRQEMALIEVITPELN